MSVYAPRRAAPHRTAPHRTAPHRTATGQLLRTPAALRWELRVAPQNNFYPHQTTHPTHSVAAQQARRGGTRRSSGTPC
ncbi:hypothetical protein EYF80_050936 [Liparis tanakae]|uniref:Uncharacterized protein n=1 Tax=Liparis tanakae TaxID=230148 RepID=A0A4Z2FCE0_9TELE|nr:hypothetical protein EYF80_050936 [Liparis tanakae]